MSAIPDDIITAGRLEAERYARWLHTMKTKGSLSPRAIEGLADTFSRITHSERQRTDDLIEEVKRVLGPFADIAPSVEYTDLRDGNVVHRQRVTTDETADGPLLGWKELTKDHFSAARALLSKLEGR